MRIESILVEMLFLTEQTRSLFLMAAVLLPLYTIVFTVQYVKTVINGMQINCATEEERLVACVIAAISLRFRRYARR